MACIVSSGNVFFDLAGNIFFFTEIQKKLGEVLIVDRGAIHKGDRGAVALLCNALPGTVLVSTLRWSENSVDMTLQCEDAKLDLPRIINPLGYWKIGQLQQRQGGDSAVATINLKLVPKSTEVKK